ncbi:hypothetical protein FHS72_001844 [Loktanella ponticola]|uniref:ABC-type transport auxiliary lipoprotein component domain-containing protein n=1 Tax=Yoonia ponticola TaxID=1524255 RepID=A0A7W9BKP3_9RHOB|nr:PqiC family protein [Yoonia ponticola]MBB5722220.1 hypothetical protein [Yoonia ponticola]
MIKPLFLTLALTAVAACSGPTNRVEMTPLNSTLDLRANVSSAIVRTVSLPSYAASDEISIESPEGLITTNGDVLWADEPERATTLTISRHLNDILSATVGPDPWPFAGIPDVTIEVRVEEMLAGNDGIFTLRGQYFIGGDGIDYRNTARNFAFTTPVISEGLNGIARAQSQVVLELAEDIARVLSR